METSRLHSLSAAALAATLTLAACGQKEEAAAPASAPQPVLMGQTEPPAAEAPAPRAPAKVEILEEASSIKGIVGTGSGTAGPGAAPPDHPPAAANGGGHPPAAATPPPSYSVDLRATEHLQMWGTPGQMRVWIGDPRYVPPKDADMAEKTAPLGVSGSSARVAPFVQGEVDVEPKEPKCGKVVVSGAEFLYALTPRATGTFTVGATIDLFDTPDCTGPVTPKGTKSIAVDVRACWKCLADKDGPELLAHAWRAFLQFWDKLLLLVFGLLLFLLRKKLYKLFGYAPQDGKT